MSLHTHLRERIASGHKLLVPYLCAGFPSEALTLPLLEALAESGADAIELGIPFSDPLMDGPVIQAASSRALAGGMTLPKALDLAQAFTSRHATPLILMSSFNPLWRMGAQAFAAGAQRAGIAACILPDLPPDSQRLLPGAPPLVQLVAPNTNDQRVDELVGLNPPFLYGVSLFGVTGARITVADYTLPFLRRVKDRTDLPLLAGFGVSTPEQAQTTAAACDGIIVGSALLKAIEAGTNPVTAASEFMAAFRQALDALSTPALIPSSR